MARRLWEVEQERRDCYRELEKLTQYVETSYNEEKGLDVYTHDERRMVGDSKQIQKLRERIAALDAEEKEIRKWQSEALERDSQQAKEQKELEEKAKREAAEKNKREKEKKEMTFKSIKKRYKAMSKKYRWDSLLYKLQGKSPKWKKIHGYTHEELKYLENVLLGNTAFQEDRIKQHQVNLGKTFTEKEKHERRWNDFIQKANSKISIDRGIEHEEERKMRF